MAIQFDGISGSHYTVTGANHPNTAGNWTLIIHTRFVSFAAGTGSLDRVIFAHVNSATITGIFLQHDASASSGLLQIIRATSGAPDQTVNGHTMVVNTNYQLAVVHTAGTSTLLYVNGLLSATLAGTTTTIDDLAIGGVSNPPNDLNINAAIDRFRFWTVALTQAEIRAEAISTTAVRTANLHDSWLLTTQNATSYTGQNNSKVMTNLAAGDTTFSPASSLPLPSHNPPLMQRPNMGAML